MNAIFEAMPLAEQVKAEALANGFRRETARQVASPVRGLRGPPARLYDVGDRIRSIAAELEAEEAEERRRKVKSPSDLIATMKEQWPEDSAAVKAYAAAHGLTLGAAWAKLIHMAANGARKSR